MTRLSVYFFAPVDVFAWNVAGRTTLPGLHFTVPSKPATSGDDDQWHVLALRTITVHLIVAPLAGRCRIGTAAVLAAPASEGTARATSTATAIRGRRTVRMSDLPRSLLHRGYAFHGDFSRY
jgi:hypothetical protein